MSKIVDKGLLILSAFTVERPTLSADELARLAGMPASTLYRFLGGLVKTGYVTKDPRTQTYRPGPAVLRLGRIAEKTLDVRALAIPWMDTLSEKTGETVYLTVRLGTSRLCLESRERKGGGIKFSVQPGETIPLYAGSSGKVLLAWMPAADVAEVLSSLKLRRFTPRTVTSKRRILEELAAIRERGYHFTAGEYTPGAWGLAAPVFDAHGAVVATLSLSGVLHPDGRKPPVRELARVLVEAADDISRGLGAAR